MLKIGTAALMAGLLSFSVLIGFPAKTLHAKDFSEVPVKGWVTVIDLGSKKCVPCKMMGPILEKMGKAYQGKAAIVFIDVRENKEQAERFGIRTIPTQIFFDKEGKEVFRHAGFMSEEAIVEQLKKMGVNQPGI
jgi:thioredoxin 1